MHDHGVGSGGMELGRGQFAWHAVVLMASSN